MAVKFTELESQCRQIINDVKNGNFVPVYLLMGTEPYYPDLVCDEIIKYALTDSERDFNQTVFYGLDTDAGTVASECRSYPMMAERRLVVLKEAQSMKTLEDLATYASDPMESTVLVILMHGASADKRRALYKNVQKKGVVLVSDALRDYEMPQWITSFYKSRGLDIEPAAAALLAEYAGTDMSRIMLETEKMQKNLPEGTVRVNAADIEKNVGISRQFSIFELTKALSYMKAEKALKIAAYIGNGPKFMLLLATAPLYTHFYRILKYEAALLKNPAMSKSDRAKLLGVNPYFMEEYDVAARNYPIRRCMKVISLLEEYDFKGKGGGSGEASQGDLLMELVSKILN
ncbi:MAG: DNA polymerase III subunit delta [Bacteroidales bacterium]|uniref:DNA polymerase III subunit delta n=1 Tax=Candidatus Cryptobacteroides bacterium TaxID=3085639 RepID=UPI001ECE6FB0|nr:DNA polymerase III subunit delta [Bacteroidales bacterium]